ncbi:hypothetical protein [Lentzea aerocolonigenes]|nr:hypothetical protein [Lentzea aerocolonigenes]
MTMRACRLVRRWIFPRPRCSPDAATAMSGEAAPRQLDNGPPTEYLPVFG